MALEQPVWAPGSWYRHPGIETLRPRAGWPEWGDWPDLDDLQVLLDAAPRPVTNTEGRSLRLASADINLSAAEYERRVARDSVLTVRMPGWHDLFNVLAWAAWPGAKASLNVRHAVELDRHAGPNRSPARDALTQFDEDGVIVAVSDPALERLAREFRWKDLFWRHRGVLADGFRVFVFGHALAEKLLAPFVGLTAKAVFIGVAESFHRLDLDGQREMLDDQAAALLRAPGSFASPRDLAPLPVLGMPGWWAGGESERFYDDDSYFRAGRTRTARSSGGRS
jgi:hypothetical protein